VINTKGVKNFIRKKFRVQRCSFFGNLSNNAAPKIATRLVAPQIGGFSAQAARIKQACADFFPCLRRRKAACPAPVLSPKLRSGAPPPLRKMPSHREKSVFRRVLWGC
jgi:hypothetical protein